MNQERNQQPSCDQREKLTDIKQEQRQFFKQRLLALGIRWTIGFVIIAFLVAYYPDLEWLWLAGVIIASLSLCVILGLQYFLEKKLSHRDNKDKNVSE